MPHLSTSADARIFEILKRGLVFQTTTLLNKDSSNLVVGLPFDPVACWQATEEIFSRLIIAENKDRERQGSFKEETEVHEPIAHSLLEYGEFTGLANDEIGPLDNDNGDKEGSVAGIFKDFTVLVSPLLSVRVFQIIDSNRVPIFTHSKQYVWPETTFCHNDEVDKETG